MKTQSNLQRSLKGLFITGVAVFVLTSAHAADVPKVTAQNYVRAESDFQMREYIEKLDMFGKFHHYREAYDVDNQITVSGNRDTLYSFGVFDLSSPLTITLPEPEGR